MRRPCDDGVALPLIHMHMHDVTRFYWSIDRQSLASVESDQ